MTDNSVLLNVILPFILMLANLTPVLGQILSFVHTQVGLIYLSRTKSGIKLVTYF